MFNPFFLFLLLATQENPRVVQLMSAPYNGNVVLDACPARFGLDLSRGDVGVSGSDLHTVLCYAIKPVTCIVGLWCPTIMCSFLERWNVHFRNDQVFSAVIVCSSQKYILFYFRNEQVFISEMIVRSFLRNGKDGIFISETVKCSLSEMIVLFSEMI